ARRERRDGRMHAASNDALQRSPRGISGLAQFRKLSAELIEQADEAPRRSLVCRAHIRIASVRLNDQVDRAVLQMQPLAVGEKRDLRTPRHGRRPGTSIGRTSELSLSDDSGRT